MDVYVARQAIFNVNQEVFAYELLFRNNSSINEFISIENSNPTLHVIRNSFSVIGLDKVTDGKRAFINFDGDLIKSGMIESFPKDSIAIEVLETVTPDDQIIEICKDLKEKGYMIALDDFEYSVQFDKLLKYIDVVKVDFFLTRGKERKEIVSKIRSKNPEIKFLAEKVETKEEYEEALRYGYSYFQGYFFCRPVIISGKDISGYKFNYMSLIKELDAADIDINKIESLIKNDVSLTYKLLKAANSSYYGYKRKVTSISNAIVLIGINELRKWIFITTLQNMGENTIEELVRLSLIRASFGELLSKKIPSEISSFDAFLVGMFSLSDALMNTPLEKVLSELPVSNIVREALLEKEGTLSKLLKLITSYENGNWEEVTDLIKELQLNEEAVTQCYIQAIQSIQGIESV